MFDKLAPPEFCLASPGPIALFTLARFYRPIVIEYMFRPNDTEPSDPLLLHTEIHCIQLAEENGDSGEHSNDSLIKNCFVAITETYSYYIQFTVVGPHVGISEEEIVTDNKNKYTETH